MPTLSTYLGNTTTLVITFEVAQRSELCIRSAKSMEGHANTQLYMYLSDLAKCYILGLVAAC